MKFGLTFLLLLGISFNLFSASDTLHIEEVRSFDTLNLEQYRSNSDFIYHIEPTNVGWWLGFNEWLVNLLEQIFDIEDTAALGYIINIVIRIILWALAIFAIGIIIYSLYKKGVFGLLGRKQQQVNLSDDDLLFIQNETDWDSLIKESISSLKYNEAIRYLFLQVLKNLDDSGIIELNKTKSIRDYQFELPSNYVSQFILLARYYQYAWFGGVDIDERHFVSMQTAFSDFKVFVNVG